MSVNIAGYENIPIGPWNIIYFHEFQRNNLIFNFVLDWKKNALNYRLGTKLGHGPNSLWDPTIRDVNEYFQGQSYLFHVWSAPYTINLCSLYLILPINSTVMRIHWQKGLLGPSDGNRGQGAGFHQQSIPHRPLWTTCNRITSHCPFVLFRQSMIYFNLKIF